MAAIPNIYQVIGRRVRGGYRSHISKNTINQDYLAYVLGNLRKGKLKIYETNAKTDFFLKAKPEVQELYTQKIINSMNKNAGDKSAKRDVKNFTKDCIQKGILRTLRDFYKLPEKLSDRNATKILMERMLKKSN